VRMSQQHPQRSRERHFGEHECQRGSSIVGSGIHVAAA
jgi:hypothetical protein